MLFLLVFVGLLGFGCVGYVLFLVGGGLGSTVCTQLGWWMCGWGAALGIQGFAVGALLECLLFRLFAW